MTIQDIIEGCQLGGCTLEQRLAVVSFSSLPRQQEEEKLIVAELERRRNVGRIEFKSAGAKRRKAR